MLIRNCLPLIFLSLVIFTSFWLTVFADNSPPPKASNDFGFIQIDKKEYDVSYNTTATINVNGTVYSPQALNNNVTIVFSLPDGSTRSSQVTLSSNGSFQSQLSLDYCSLKGTYFVTASYSPNPIGTISFTVKQVSFNSAPSLQTTQDQNQGSNTENLPNVSQEIKPSDIFSLARPGTVMITTIINSSITIPDPEFKQQRLADFLYTLIESGQLDPKNFEARMNAAQNELMKNPSLYLVPGTTSHTDPFDLALEGSGFLLNKDGYLVTNDHVTGGSQDEIRTEIKQRLEEAFSNTTSYYFSQFSGSQDFENLLSTFASNYVTNNVQVGEIHKQISVTVVSPEQSASKSYTAKVISSGCTIPDKDVAILKIDGTNFYSLPLGNDGNINIGDKLYVLGFPLGATLNPVLSKSHIEPTFTSGLTSAKKMMIGGWPILQTDAALTYGNSGGPVLDTRGKVIGIATFVTVDPYTGAQVPGLNFVIPTSIVKEFIDSSGATYTQDYYSASSPSNIISNNSLQTQNTPTIPNLVKNTAKWWSVGKISDSDFLQGIQYLIHNGIMKVPQGNSESSSGNNQQIPKWIKNNAQWWSDGKISDDDFIKGIQYLINNGIIKAQ